MTKNINKNNTLIKRLFLSFCFVFVFSFSDAQFYNGSQLSFGKNRIQYADFFWSYYRYERFDTYFYLGGKELSIYTAHLADSTIKEVESFLDYQLQDRIQFIIFNKLSDLKQSNIGLLSDDQYNIGGVTYINGSKVMLYFDGNHKNFEKQIRAGIAQIMVNQMIYGSNLGSNVKNSTLLSLPDWYLKGLVSYISEDWSVDVDNKVQNGILSGKYKNFNILSGEDATNAGHSIWRYVGLKYGNQSIPNIVYLTKISRSIENGFLYIIGVSFKNLAKNWIEFYEKSYNEQNKRYIEPEGSPLLAKTKRTRIYSQVRISPDGNYIAYATNEMGQIKIWLKNNQTGKIKKLYRLGHKLDEKVDYSYPIISWHPSNQFVSYMVEKKGRLIMTNYSLETKKKEYQRFFQMEKISDFSYSDDGKLIAISGVQNGVSNIYVFNRMAKTYEKITNDPFDDLNPRFINSDKDIVFSSNRTCDTLLKPYALLDKVILKKDFDIYICEYNKKSPILLQATNTRESDETMPMEYEKGYVSFLSDMNGIRNRYLLHVDSTFSHIDTTTHYRKIITNRAITNFNNNIETYDISVKSGKIAEVFNGKKKYSILINDLIPSSKINPINTSESEYKIAIKRQLFIKDSIEKANIIKQNKIIQKSRLRAINLDESTPKDTSKKVNIYNYTFGVEKKKNSSTENPITSDSTKDTIKKEPKFETKSEKNTPEIVQSETDSVIAFILPKQRTYETSYQINQLTTQIDFSYLNSSYQSFTGGTNPIFINPGMGAFMKVGVADIFENYRITGGVRIPSGLNAEYIVSYENLSKRLDEEWILHRVSMDNVENGYYIKHHTNEILYHVKWPLSNIMGFRTTITGRHDQAISKSMDLNSLNAPNSYKYWGGIKGEFIFDNTVSKGLNIFFGTRYKIFAENFIELNATEKNMTVVGFDFRNYKKIHKTFIWANRVAASSSFGKERLIYYMGGVDTWLFPKFNSNIQVDQNQNYAYQTLATNMRGFQQNIRNGNSFFVVNSELRFPAIKYFSNRPLKSDIFENFQIIGFGDLGTAWTGSNPYSKENSLFKQVIHQTPLTITLENIREPIVGGYGFGLRTRLFGYFIRADWAWGVEDGIIQPRVFYLSFSLDF